MAITQRMRSMPRRTQYAILFLALLFGVKAVESMNSMRTIAQEKFMSANEQTQLLRMPNAIETWQERAAQARQHRVEWSEHLWSGETTGVVAATLQAELAQMLDARELGGAIIQVDPEEFDIPIGGAGVRFTLTVRNGNVDQLIALLADIAGYNRWLIMDDVSILVTRSPRATLTASGIAPLLSSTATSAPS